MDHLLLQHAKTRLFWEILFSLLGITRMNLGSVWGILFELEGFLNRQKTGKGLVNTTIMFILDSVESME